MRQVADLIRDYAAREGEPYRAPETAAEMFTTLLRGFYGDVMLRNRSLAPTEIRAWSRRMVKVFVGGRSNW